MPIKICIFASKHFYDSANESQRKMRDSCDEKRKKRIVWAEKKTNDMNLQMCTAYTEMLKC